MSPGVCTAPVPAPERDCPSEGCQLAVRREPYLQDRQEARRQGGNVKERRWLRLPSTLLLDASPRRLLLLVFPSRLLIPPPHPRQRHLVGPHLVECVAVVEPAVLHHPADLRRVVDVLE